MIHIEHLGKTYHRGEQQVEALRDISVTIEAGEFVAVTGASGSGKSTLLNVLGCLDQPSNGMYRLNGQDVSGMDDQALSAIRNREIGFVFQSFNLVPHLNVMENVDIALFWECMAGAQRWDVWRVCVERVGVADRMSHGPGELSGGECQRVAIARAVANAPAIILADEPTGNLDRTTSEEIMALFGDLQASGKTMIIVTHDMHIASFADRVLQLDHGRIDHGRLAHAPLDQT